MILQMLSDPRTVELHRNSQRFKLVFWSDAIKQEKFWCVDRASTEDDFFARSC